MRVIQILLLFLACTIRPAGAAELAPASAPAPWSAGASVSVTSDSNATRSNGAAVVSDRLLAESLNGQYTLPVSLQKFVFSAQVSNVHYRTLTFLDYQGNDLSVAWLGDLAGSLSPVVTLSDRRALVPLSNFAVAVRDVVHDQEARLTLDKDLDPHWLVGLQLSSDQQSNSDPGNAYNDNTTGRVALRARYAAASGDEFSLLAQQGQTRFRIAQTGLAGPAVNNTYRDQVLDLGWKSLLPQALQFDARAGWQQRNYEDATTRNFSGATGRLSLRRSGPVLELGTGFERTLGGVLYLAASTLVVDRFSVDGRWKFSPLTSLNASWSHARERYQGDLLNADRLDIHVMRNLNLQYAATPAVGISLGIAADTRSSSFSVNDFEDHLIQLAVSLRL